MRDGRQTEICFPREERRRSRGNRSEICQREKRNNSVSASRFREPIGGEEDSEMKRKMMLVPGERRYFWCRSLLAGVTRRPFPVHWDSLYLPISSSSSSSSNPYSEGSRLHSAFLCLRTSAPLSRITVSFD